MPFPKFTLLIARAPVKPLINCPANEPSVHKTEFKNALKESIELNIPCVIDCQIDSDDKVFPMVPANTSISEAFSEEDLAAKGYDC